MNEVGRLKNVILNYIKETKPIDLWQDKIDMLNERRYIDFIVFVKTRFDLGKLVVMTDELIAAIQKEWKKQ